MNCFHLQELGILASIFDDDDDEKKEEETLD
jgi:hypothetical protein